MYVQPMTLAFLISLFAMAILGIAAASAWRGLGIKVNLLCVAGILITAWGASNGWTYSQGDVGWSTGWIWIILAGVFISLVSPLGGFVQIIALLSDFGVGSERGAEVVGGEWFALAVLGSMLVVVSIVTPFGVNLSMKNAGTVARLLTVSPSKSLKE